MTPPGVAELRDRLRDFRYTAFRLETLQAYSGSSEDPAHAAFQRGDHVPPPDPDQDQWISRLQANCDAGRTQQRVHVVREPVAPTSYVAFELTWEYGPHASAGEDIRIIPVTDTWPADIPQADFWLFDSRHLFVLDYDHAGRWLGARPVDDPTRVAHACFVRDAALHQAMTWSDYITTKPELLRRVPGSLAHGAV